MPDTIRKVDYFSTQVSNRPGQTFRVLSTLVSAGINLLACTGFPRGRRSQIDVVPDDTRKFKAAAKKAGLNFNPRRRPASLFKATIVLAHWRTNLKKLADARVNVTAVDGLVAGKGRWGAILWVKPKDVRKTGQVLRAKSR